MPFHFMDTELRQRRLELPYRSAPVPQARNAGSTPVGRFKGISLCNKELACCVFFLCSRFFVIVP
jgi:hypothetical protein